MRWVSRAAAASILSWLILLAGWMADAAAKDQRQNAPGAFDFYVLSLSWSPSFCAAAAERGSTSRSQQGQCGERPFSFVVHGLWPQYEHGFPDYCQRPAPRLDRRIMTSMLDLMPAPGLIYSQWDKHGTCSGLSAEAYFDTVRKSRAAVKDSGGIPRSRRTEEHDARCHRERLHQEQSGPQPVRNCSDLRPDQAQRGANLHEQGPAIPRV